MGRNSSHAFRLPASLKRAAEILAREDGTTLNSFIVTAVAEKLALRRTAASFSERIERGDLAASDRFMRRSDGAPLQPDDTWDATGPAASGPDRH